jgi:hypothetical protein
MLPRLLPLSSRSFLLLLSSPPFPLPLFARTGSWSRDPGWICLSSLRLPFLWLLLLRYRSSSERLKELGGLLP